MWLRLEGYGKVAGAHPGRPQAFCVFLRKGACTPPCSNETAILYAIGVSNTVPNPPRLSQILQMRSIGAAHVFLFVSPLLFSMGRLYFFLGQTWAEGKVEPATSLRAQNAVRKQTVQKSQSYPAPLTTSAPNHPSASNHSPPFVSAIDPNTVMGGSPYEYQKGVTKMKINMCLGGCRDVCSKTSRLLIGSYSERAMSGRVKNSNE